MPFFQYGSCCFFSAQFFWNIQYLYGWGWPGTISSHDRHKVSGMICLFLLYPHGNHITVEYRHGMITTHQLRSAAFLIRLFSQFQPRLIWWYTSQGMLDSCSSEIRRYLWKTKVKIKSCLVLFRTISGNPRQFNYRDESAGVWIFAQCK